MFHTTHIHLPQNRRRSALRTFITSSSFGPPDTKEPLRRGILLTAVAFVLLLIGSILTWLGFNEVFGGRMSMTGPLLIALSLLLLLLSFRQFLLARKRNTNPRSSMPLDSVNAGTVTAVVVNHDDGLHPATIIVDRYNRRGYDAPVTVHRPSEVDCAPPSYQEVTQHSSSSITPSCATDELPPTYEETMSSSLYHHHPLFSSITHQERGGYIPASNTSAARSFAGTGRGGSDLTSGRISERESSMGQSGALPSIASAFPQSMHRPSPNVMQLDTVRGTGAGVAPPAPTPSVTVHPTMRSARTSLPLPPQHMSAPASPRQLSAPPSPHPFSAPPSPRQLNPHQHLTTPPQFLSPSDSSPNLSLPPSLNLFSGPPSPYPYSGPPSPLNFSAPPSPRPYSGQHSLTPPPQYTSAPPSPRQLSAPPSPLMWSSPHPQYFMSGSYPIYPLSPQPYATPPMSRHLPGPPPPHHFSTPSSLPQHAQSWAPPPNVGGSSSQEGYTCFTYNFVTPLPVETSPSTPTLYGHTSTLSNPAHTNSPHPGFQGEIRSPNVLTRPQAVPGSVNAGLDFVPRAPEYQNVNNHRGGETTQQAFPITRTDIQANI
ncbi:uncharacterized protein [Littorina saxatilis]|uniref:Uncharacterized protein n=1 Tax=Littorina saxatilis TaxID=31220 RepID=A0AAN9GFH3_9CAEN